MRGVDGDRTRSARLACVRIGDDLCDRLIGQGIRTLVVRCLRSGLELPGNARDKSRRRVFLREAEPIEQARAVRELVKGVGHLRALRALRPYRLALEPFEVHGGEYTRPGENMVDRV